MRRQESEVERGKRIREFVAEQATALILAKHPFLPDI